jgi:hypothetical protein
VQLAPVGLILFSFCVCLLRDCEAIRDPAAATAQPPCGKANPYSHAFERSVFDFDRDWRSTYRDSSTDSDVSDNRQLQLCVLQHSCVSFCSSVPPFMALHATTCSANDKRLHSGRCVYLYYLGADHARYALFRGRFSPDRVVRPFTDEVSRDMVVQKERAQWTQDEITVMVGSVLVSGLFLFLSWSTHSPSFLA